MAEVVNRSGARASLSVVYAGVAAAGEVKAGKSSGQPKRLLRSDGNTNRRSRCRLRVEAANEGAGCRFDPRRLVMKACGLRNALISVIGRRSPLTVVKIVVEAIDRIGQHRVANRKRWCAKFRDDRWVEGAATA